jgi:hypothetical protein
MLLIIRVPYTFSILLSRYLSSECYKNDKFLENVGSRRYNIFECIRYLSGGHEYFGKIV